VASHGQEKAELLGKKTCLSANFSITNLLWIDKEFNPRFCSEKLALTPWTRERYIEDSQKVQSVPRCKHIPSRL